MDGPDRPKSNWGGPPKSDYLEGGTDWRPEVKPRPEPPRPGDKPPDDKEKEPKEKPIDPGMPVNVRRAPGAKIELHERFPNLRPIIEKLDEIGEEEFYSKLENVNPDYPQLLLMANDMRDAMLFKAIVDGWSEENLYKEYRATMKTLLIQCTGRSVLSEMLGHLRRGLRAVIDTKPSSNQNPHLKNRKLNKRDRGHLLTELKMIDPQLIEEDPVWDNYCIKWGGDECDESVDSSDLNEKQVEFVEETVFDFYRSYLINRRLVENKSADDIKKEWLYWAANLYSTCQGGAKGAAGNLVDKAGGKIKEGIVDKLNPLNWIK